MAALRELIELQTGFRHSWYNKIPHLQLNSRPETNMEIKMENGSGTKYALNEPLAVADPEVHAILRAEKHRQVPILYSCTVFMYSYPLIQCFPGNCENVRKFQMCYNNRLSQYRPSDWR